MNRSRPIRSQNANFNFNNLRFGGRQNWLRGGNNQKFSNNFKQLNVNVPEKDNNIIKIEQGAQTIKVEDNKKELEQQQQQKPFEEQKQKLLNEHEKLLKELQNQQQQQQQHQQQLEEQKQKLLNEKEKLVKEQQKLVKDELKIKIANNNEKDKMEVDINSEKIDENVAKRRPWHVKKIKKPSRIRRMRQNVRLRRLLKPKNAITSLYELDGTKVSNYTMTENDKGFSAEVIVNGIRYEGNGPTNMAAKSNASEKALRDQIIQRIILSKSKQGTPKTLESDEDAEMLDETEEPSDIPMLHLASFALYKLFNEWQQDGFEIPNLKGLGMEKSPFPIKKPLRTELPENANSMHPSMLLVMMRPQTQYVSLDTEDGQPLNKNHKVSATIDGKMFVGEARNKKTARKNCASQACNELFGTNYEIEILPMPSQPSHSNVSGKKANGDAKLA